MQPLFFMFVLLSVDVLRAKRPGLELEQQWRALRPQNSLLQSSPAALQTSKGFKFAYAWYLADKDSDIACAILVAASTVSGALRSGTDLVVVHNEGVPGEDRFANSLCVQSCRKPLGKPLVEASIWRLLSAVPILESRKT